MRKGRDQKKQRYFSVGLNLVFMAMVVFVGAGLVFGQDPIDSSVADALQDSEPSVKKPKTVMELFANPTDPAQTTTVSGGGIFDDNLMNPPTTNDVTTILEAAEYSVQKADKRFVLLSTNEIEKLHGPYKMPFSGRVKLHRFLSQILPVVFDVWEQPIGDVRDDVPIVYLGLVSEINKKQTDYDTERLANNRTRITFVAKGISLYDAVMKIGELAKVDISTEYMRPSDRMLGSTNVVSSISEFSSPSNVVEQASAVYASITQETEWRNVLFRILDPKDYAFDEVSGYVRVARKTWFAEQKGKEQEAKPLVTRVVRLYHANPEDIVEKIEALNVMVSSKAKVMVAPFRETSDKVKDKSSRDNLRSGSSTLSTGAGSVAGATDTASGSSWGDLLRPKNPPAVILHDIEENMDKLVALIRSMDVREKQVLIEALVLDLGDKFIKDLGVNWTGFNEIGLGGFAWSLDREHTRTRDSENIPYWERTETGTVTTDFKTGRETVTGDTVDGLDSKYWNRTTSVGKTVKEFTGLLGPVDFTAVLSMVQTDSDNRVLSSPVLTIGDHSESMIHVGNVVPIANIKTSYLGDKNDNLEVDIEWMEITTGMLIWVGPEITEDGEQVRLWVHPKLIELTGEWEEVGQTRYPHLTSSEMDTRVTVPSGNTLMLGGLTRVEDTEFVKKIPILGDIPLLGRLFRSKGTRKDQRNLVILIRPTILDQGLPETGFEKPALAIADPMMRTSGRNLVPKDMKADDKMLEREKRIREKLLGKETENSEEADVETEEEDMLSDELVSETVEAESEQEEARGESEEVLEEGE